ncbi:MAG: hypothetical protein IIY72_04685, partial [Solobacterium sp.]|nr:hypothetical protein [Solobacterium sp.]
FFGFSAAVPVFLRLPVPAAFFFGFSSAAAAVSAVFFFVRFRVEAGFFSFASVIMEQYISYPILMKNGRQKPEIKKYFMLP